MAGVMAVCVGMGVGCSGSSGSRGGDQETYATRGLSRTPAEDGGIKPRAGSTMAEASRPVVAIDGMTLSEVSVWPAVAEAAGPAVANEIVLTYLATRECEQTGIRITQADLEAEQRMVTQSMAGVAGTADPDRALDRIRRERGLGPERWKMLLRRNAMLRALVRDRVTITEESIDRAYQLRYGPTYQTRLIMVSSAQVAGEAVRRARAGEDFGALAAALSTDSSAARGGLIDAINPADASWPVSVRQAVPGLNVGEVSDVIVVDGGYAVVRLESMNSGAGAPALASVRGEMERVARIEAERLAMQQLAGQMIAAARVEILDPSLGWGG